MNRQILDPSTLTDDGAELIAEDSQVDIYLSRVLGEATSNLTFDVAADHELRINIIDFMPGSCDISLLVNLAHGARAEVQLASLCPKDSTKVFRLNVNHFGSDSYSRVTMAGINLDNGTLRFLGNSYIRNGAHRSDTRQQGKITNLSEFSKSEVSPSLLIKENDVKASHGAALGAYDPNVIFYLESRGLSLEQAKKLITFGNLLPIIESFHDKAIVEKAKASLGDLSL